jgi:uncharacterized RDD family membrane protein YckC
MPAANPYAAPRHGANHAQTAVSSGWAPAGFPRRLAALIIDSVALTVACLLLLLVLMRTSKDPSAILAIYQLSSIAITLLYFIGMPIACRATLGKMAMGIEIRSSRTGNPPASAGALIGRYFAHMLSSLPLFLGYLWSLWEKRGRCWHDLICGTVVVRRARRTAGARPATGRVARLATARFSKPSTARLARPPTATLAKRTTMLSQHPAGELATAIEIGDEAEASPLRPAAAAPAPVPARPPVARPPTARIARPRG